MEQEIFFCLSLEDSDHLPPPAGTHKRSCKSLSFSNFFWLSYQDFFKSVLPGHWVIDSVLFKAYWLQWRTSGWWCHCFIKPWRKWNMHRVGSGKYLQVTADIWWPRRVLKARYLCLVFSNVFSVQKQQMLDWPVQNQTPGNPCFHLTNFLAGLACRGEEKPISSCTMCAGTEEKFGPAGEAVLLLQELWYLQWLPYTMVLYCHQVQRNVKKLQYTREQMCGGKGIKVTLLGPTNT